MRNATFLARFNAIAQRLEAKMSDAQARIDADTAAVVAATTEITNEIAALKAANPDVDTTALDNAVAPLAALAAANQPATPTTTTDPTATTTDPTAETAA